MKRIKLLIVAILAMTAVTANVNAAGKKTVSEITYKVSMDCEGCKSKIEDKIPFEKGVKDLEVDLKTKLVTVKYYSSKTDSDTIKKAIEKLDFKVEVVTTNNSSSSSSKTSSSSNNSSSKSTSNKK